MSSSEWSEWQDVDGHRGCKAKIGIDMDGGWIHYLLAPYDEPDPRNNHIHIKYKNSVDNTPVLCGVTDNGRKSHSRRSLLERVNDASGLNLSHR